MQQVDIVKDFVPGPGATGQQSVTTTAAKLNAPARAFFSGVRLKADVANNGTIFVGFVPTVSSSIGYALGPGEDVPIPEEFMGNIYLVASAGSQKLYWMAK